MTTTQHRLDALREFFDVTRRNHDELTRPRQDFIAFDRQEEEETLFSCRVPEPEDAEAPSTIGL
jgi:hypothetical protein